MSDNDDEDEPPQCEYVFDPDESDVPDVAQSSITEEWRCPHYAEDNFEGEDLCLFHLPTSEKDANKVNRHFVDCVSADGAAVKRFIGAKFEELALLNLVLGSNDNNPIDLRQASFEHGLDFSGSTITQPLYLTGADIKGEFRLPATILQGRLFAQYVDVEEGILCTEAEFSGSVNFRNSTFNGFAKFRDCQFDGETSFYGCEFNADPELPQEGMEIANHRPSLVIFSESTFSQGINLNSAIFNYLLDFERVTANGTVHMNDVELNDKQHSYFYIVPESDSAPEERPSGHHVAEISGDIKRLRVSIENTAEEPCIISLQDTNIDSGSLGQPESSFVYYDFTGATLGDIQFKDMNSQDAWRHLIFNQTDFEGVNFIDYRSALDECNYDLCSVHDPHDLFEEIDLTEKENTYLKARIGAERIRDRKSSSEFHIRELDNRRSRLWKQGDWLSFAAHLLYGFTSRYGEKPSRVLAVFTPVLLISYSVSNLQEVPSILSGTFGLLFAVLPPIFSGLLVLASYRYIGN